MAGYNVRPAPKGVKGLIPDSTKYNGGVYVNGQYYELPSIRKVEGEKLRACIQ